jgi:ADP-ribose pyrophosphatase YjhB (NUDIX family)
MPTPTPPADRAGGLQLLALRVFPRLPSPLRRLAVRVVTPTYTVGTVCVIEHAGDVLLLRQVHRGDWGLPGGLLDRGETPAEGVRREVREEIGVEVVVGLPLVTDVDPATRRIDVVFHIEVTDRFQPRPRGEALEAAWIRPADLGEDSQLTRGLLELVAAARRAGAQQGHVVG